MATTINIADKETLDKVYNIVKESKQVFGFIERGDTLAPQQRIEYIGVNANYTPFSLNTSTGAMNLGSWADFEWLLGVLPAMVKFDGTLDYWLNPDDYNYKEDGTTASDVANEDYAGNAMVWIPKIYKYEKRIGADRIVKFSMSKINDDFEAVGFMESETKELSGIWIPMFYGSIDSNGKMRSIAGPYGVSNKNTTQEYEAITAVGTRARFFGGAIAQTLVDLMIMFAKNTNLQACYGMGNSSGYNSSDTTNYGKLANAVVEGGAFYGTATAKAINKVFHSMVLITQNQWQRDPYVIINAGKLLVSPYYKYSLTGEGYQEAGFLADVGAGNWYYPNRRNIIPHFGDFPDITVCKGSTSTGVCDGVYCPEKWSTFVCVPFRFATCSNGTAGGPRCLALYASAGLASWGIGASLLLFPPA